MNKKCVIITTIHEPSEAIKEYLKKTDYDLIIVGDVKTNYDYSKEKCIYLDIEKQDALYGELSKLIPKNHYGRKNLGYLYAIQNGYDVVYETDDDNIPHVYFDDILNSEFKTKVESENSWVNVFQSFTSNYKIWPRGFPLSMVQDPPLFSETTTDAIRPSIVVGLIDGEPDVDAIFRLTGTRESIEWKVNKNIYLSNKNIFAFNTQNIFWIDKEILAAMLIPCSVSFRYCDILRGIIANTLLNALNKQLAITSPNVTQIRNKHNLMEDFKSEIEMYLNNEKILNVIGNNVEAGMGVKSMLSQIYTNLLREKIITELDNNILKLWLKNF